LSIALDPYASKTRLNPDPGGRAGFLLSQLDGVL
jgi:hypothetical protein